MKRVTTHLYFWVLLGALLPDQGAAPDAFKASSLKPLGDGFIAILLARVGQSRVCRAGRSVMKSTTPRRYRSGAQ